MSVLDDIIRTWRAPRRVVRDLLNMGEREDRAVAYLMAGCFVVFIAQWPRLSRRVAEGTAPEGVEGYSSFQGLVVYEFIAWLIVWPLVFYGIAAVLHGIRSAMGASGTGYSARLATFWALLAASPAALFFGLTAGFIGPGLQTNIAGGIWLLAVSWFTVQGLREGAQSHG